MRVRNLYIFSSAFAFCLFACKADLKQTAHEPQVVLASETKDSFSNQAYSNQEELSTFEGLVSNIESKDRVIWQKPDLVINLLGDLRNKTVADIGAGTGYFAFRLIPKAQKVIAIDIDPRLITFMDSIKVRLSDAAKDRFVTRLAPPDNPKLTDQEADVVILVDTYGYIKKREKYLSHIKKRFEGRRPNLDH